MSSQKRNIEPAQRHIVITGASSGIGSAIALGYAAPGVTLSLTGRDEIRLTQTVQACEARGAQVSSALLDVTEANALDAWLKARDDAQPVDVVIAAAGIGGADVVPSANGESAALADTIFGVNTLGVVNTVTPLLPRMIARRRGHLALIGSIAGRLGLPQSPVYCASKAAVHVYADGLRRLVAPDGLSVTTIIPGFVDTPMSQSLKMARPYCWSAERAAARIIAAISKRERRCIFPWPLRIVSSLAYLVPLPVLDFVLSRANKVIRPGPSTR